MGMQAETPKANKRSRRAGKEEEDENDRFVNRNRRQSIKKEQEKEADRDAFDKEEVRSHISFAKERRKHTQRDRIHDESFTANQRERQARNGNTHTNEGHRQTDRDRSPGKERPRHKLDENVRHVHGKRSAEKQIWEARNETEELMQVMGKKGDHVSSKIHQVETSDEVGKCKRRLDQWRTRDENGQPKLGSWFSNFAGEFDDKENAKGFVSIFDEGTLCKAQENVDLGVFNALPHKFHDSTVSNVLPHELRNSPNKEKLVGFSIGQGKDSKAIDKNMQENSVIRFDEEDDMEIMRPCGANKEEDLNIKCNSPCATLGDHELDPLDAYMNSVVLPEVQEFALKNMPSIADTHTPNPFKGNYSSDGTDSEETDEIMDTAAENDAEFLRKVTKQSKIERLSIAHDASIKYESFRKSFYTVVKEIARMTAEEVSVYRRELDVKTHGKQVSRPVKTWNQTGLSSKALERLKKLGFEKPLPIQAQALPIIMSGRDCIGIAKTGSGKTLAYVLPMLRHIMCQEPLSSGEGPIGLIMAPTRELVQQIYSDIKKFSKGMNLSVVAVYGGCGVAQQINHLKSGAEIVVCTPGRMIDTLCGKITNLRRVTYLVLDEADRMFDMGFEPQITRIIQNIRPDCQTVLFSATFPRQVEVLARKVLKSPAEIQVGGRSVVNKDIMQIVEVRPEADRFLRLLEVLGEQLEKGKVLVFVHTQTKCDSLFTDLVKVGYPCLSLHGGKDQMDRESTISDFKSNVCSLLIATSVAARGLDVKELDLVINYDVPNHYEDYVHRVGRTGRAGRKGRALTFISDSEARYAPDLVKALGLAEQPVPQDLKNLADDFMAKVKQGTEHLHSSGFGGRGFKYDEEEEETRRAAKKALAKEYGFAEVDDEGSDSESDNTEVVKAGDASRYVAAVQVTMVVARVASQTYGAVIEGQPALEATQATLEKPKSGSSGLCPLPPSGIMSSMQHGGTKKWLHVRCIEKRMPWNELNWSIVSVI